VKTVLSESSGSSASFSIIAEEKSGGNLRYPSRKEGFRSSFALMFVWMYGGVED
jgi:hypothetical protein